MRKIESSFIFKFKTIKCYKLYIIISTCSYQLGLLVKLKYDFSHKVRGTSLHYIQQFRIFDVSLIRECLQLKRIFDPGHVTLKTSFIDITKRKLH